ncbi:MAG: sensor histidine kinase [Helicobacteraceae bacterium]|nr:sensor histidine kinase [Helicobacteraceae bacterium]
MSVSRKLDIDLLASEKQSLRRFLSLYILLTIIIISIFSFVYYEFQKDLMLQEKRVTLQEYSRELIHDLKKLHSNFNTTQTYPRYENFTSSIFDNNKKLIFRTSNSTKVPNKILSLKDNTIRLVSVPESYYLGATYILIEAKDDQIWLEKTKKTILLFSTISFIFMSFIGYVLMRLFLKPMRDALQLLDHFIKDTTHELNTPVTTIVANIEMIDHSSLDPKLLKKIKRIDIGAKTISNIYQDLTYLTLGNKIISHDQELNVASIAKERVEYFRSIADAKKVTLEVDVQQESTLNMDLAKFSKLLDNLLSNAIKYNVVNGNVKVTIYNKSIIVEDSGIGIPKDKLSKILTRYSRFNKSTGGFGIGLNIVSLICKEYDLSIEVSSELKIGTKVSISWLK